MKVGDLATKAIQSKPPSETREFDGNKWNISLPKTRIHTLDQLIEYCEIDLSVWEVERFVANKWEVGAKDANHDVQIHPLFQVKATFRKRVEIIDAKKEIEDLKAAAKRFAKIPAVIKRPKRDAGNMLEINIPDLHVGKLAWGQETGGPDYDTKLAEKIFEEALEVLLARVSGYAFHEVLFVAGNDLLNSDDVEGRTTKGTHVSTDTRYQKTFKTTRDMMIRAIEKLRLIAKVKVAMIPGNHDSLSVWHLGDSLECYFHKYQDVEIDNTPRSRKYHRFGSVMLMFAHGDKGKIAEFPMLMAIEEPEMFGQTKHRECHTGHRHRKQDSKLPQVDEKLGVRVRILSALCPADDWHAENGFVGNLRSAEAYIWNKDSGLIGTAVFSKPHKDQ
jgi:hypothetical protein